MKKWNKLRIIHPNSVNAYWDGVLNGSLSEREDEILTALVYLGRATDKRIAEYLGYPHKSAVQPRISDLINDAGILEEVGHENDKITGKPVRVVRIKSRVLEGAAS